MLNKNFTKSRCRECFDTRRARGTTSTCWSGSSLVNLCAACKEFRASHPPSHITVPLPGAKDEGNNKDNDEDEGDNDEDGGDNDEKNEGENPFPTPRVHTPAGLPVYYLNGTTHRVCSVRDILTGDAHGERILAVYNGSGHIIRGALSSPGESECQFVGLEARKRLRELAGEDLPRLRESHRYTESALTEDAWEYFLLLGYIPPRNDERTYDNPPSTLIVVGEEFIRETYIACFPEKAAKWSHS